MVGWQWRVSSYTSYASLIWLLKLKSSNTSLTLFVCHVANRSHIDLIHLYVYEDINMRFVYYMAYRNSDSLREKERRGERHTERKKDTQCKSSRHTVSVC